MATQENDLLTVRVTFVANDAAPSFAAREIFAVIEEVGTELGAKAEIQAYLGDGKPISESTEEIREGVTNSDVLWRGISYPERNAEKERAASVTAHEVGIDDWAYCDREYVYNRLGEYPNGIFVTSDRQRHEALGVFYSGKIEIVAAGNPQWQGWSFPTLSKSDVRQKLSIPEDALVIIAGGHKVISASDYLYTSLGIALAKPWFQNLMRPICILMFPHPGDVALQANLNIYAELEEFADDHTTFRLVRKEVMSTDEAMPAADIFVGITAANTRQAAQLGIPVIDFTPEFMINRLHAMDGVHMLKATRMGLARPLYNAGPGELSEMMYRLLFTPDGEELFKQQRELCPAPLEPKEAAKVMARTLITKGLEYVRRVSR